MLGREAVIVLFFTEKLMAVVVVVVLVAMTDVVVIGLRTAFTSFLIQLLVRIVWCNLGVESLKSIKQIVRSVEVQSVQKIFPFAAMMIMRVSFRRFDLTRAVKGSTSTLPRIEWTRRVNE